MHFFKTFFQVNWNKNPIIHTIKNNGLGDDCFVLGNLKSKTKRKETNKMYIFNAGLACDSLCKTVQCFMHSKE